MGSYTEEEGFAHESKKEYMYEVIHEVRFSLLGIVWSDERSESLTPRLSLSQLFIFMETLMYYLRAQCDDFVGDKRERIYGTKNGSSRGISISDARKDQYATDDSLFECRYFGPGARCNDVRGSDSCMGFFRQLCGGDDLQVRSDASREIIRSVSSFLTPLSLVADQALLHRAPALRLLFLREVHPQFGGGRYRSEAVRQGHGDRVQVPPCSYEGGESV